MANAYAPDPKLKFTFGLWTVGNIGRDPFGDPTRSKLSTRQILELLSDVNAYGVNFHDNDAIPIESTAAQSDALVKAFRKDLKDTGLQCPMCSANLFSDPVFKDGAFTSNNPAVRAFAVKKVIQTLHWGKELGCKIYVFWGGREGTESDATKSPIDSIKRFRECMDYVLEYNVANKLGYKFAFEAKPNEPRGHMYFAVTGSYLALIPTLKYPELCGVNPEVAHEHMAGLNFVHHVGQAIEMGKLFHIDLNDQEFGRYDQDFRFGSVNLKHAFFLVKMLEDSGYNGNRHFDAHAYRQSDAADVKNFAAGCMRTYMILKEKAAVWNADPEIQGLLKEITPKHAAAEKVLKGHSAASVKALAAMDLDRIELAKAPLHYEKLDQLTMEVLMGVR